MIKSKLNLQILSSLSTECRRKQKLQNDDPIDDYVKNKSDFCDF